jgi:hypothetical protein
MPRLSRESTHVHGGLVHFICRFVDYRFVLDDEARAVYLRFLGRALRRADWRLISYALMSSHVHLGLIVGANTLRSWCHSLHVRFSAWVNRRLRHRGLRALGHVFADRPSTKLVDISRAGLLISYHHRNPIDGGLVESAEQSDWTSHRAYLGTTAPVAGLDVGLGLRLAGYEATTEGRRSFHAFVCRSQVDPSQLAPDGAPKQVEASDAAPALSAIDVMRVAAATMDVPVEAILSGSRARPVVTARRVALVAWLELGGVTEQMADALHITSSGASRLLTRPHDAARVSAAVRAVVPIACRRT